MQRAARSIVPTENREGFVGDETDNSTVSNTESQASGASEPNAEASQPTRRRRGGRRVVRGTGAAGASLELQVQEHAAPLFEAPALPDADASASAETTDNNASDDEKHPARRTRSRRSADNADYEDRPTRRRAVADDDDEPRPVRRRRTVSDDLEEDDERPIRRRRVASDDFDEDNDRLVRRRRSVIDDLEDDDAPRSSRRRTAVDDSDEDGDRPVRRRRSTTNDRDDRDDEPRSARRTRSRRSSEDAREENPDERVLDVIDALPAGHESARRGKPMTSLLFQEPVLPDMRHDDRDDEEDDGEQRSRSSRRSRAREDEADYEERPSRSRRSSRSDHGDHDDHDDRDDSRNNRRRNETQDDFDADGQSDSRRSRRSRRLNAQERRAAAEVEQIEEDLELDDITYSPIAEEENDEESDSTRTRSRRRRRRRGGKNAESGDEQDDQQLTRRSRKQQYIDEITDVEGSTRLEAKKQRRRDNRRERSRQSQLMEQDFLARRENVDRLMVVREKEHHTQISVVEDNILVEHYVSDIQEVQTVGNIYLGRVQNVLPSMEAAFVDIGQARNGVLYAGEVNWDAARLEGQPRRIELAFKSGDPVLVQVTKDPIGHKGARLTSQVTLAGRFLVLVPSGGMTGVSRKLSERERSRLKGIVSKIAPKDMGVIIRTAAEGASEEAIVKDLESLVRQWERINAKREEFWHGKRPKLLQGEPDVAIRVVRDIFNDDFGKLIVEGDKVYDRIEEYLDTMAPDLKDKLEKWDPAEHEGKDVFDKWQIDSQLRKGMERQVYLPSGGSIVIDRTEAMTTIDVNTGRFIGKGKSLEETVTRCNLEASEEIARQLRLRDIGGMVMIDYVDMVMPANRDLVLRRLVECLARDRTKHQVAEVTSLGLVQMTRKRIGQGLVEAFSEECPTCKGRGFILHDQPTVSADYDDPYALRGGDPFVKTNKHGRGTAPAPEPAGSSADVKAKLAQIAAAAVAANNTEEE